MEKKFQQIKVTVDDKYLKIINEAFQLNKINVIKIDKRFPSDHYFYVLIDEFAIPFEALTKVEKHLKKNSDMLFLKWIGIEHLPTSDYSHLFKICIKA